MNNFFFFDAIEQAPEDHLIRAPAHIVQDFLDDNVDFNIDDSFLVNQGVVIRNQELIDQILFALLNRLIITEEEFDANFHALEQFSLRLLRNDNIGMDMRAALMEFLVLMQEHDVADDNIRGQRDK